MGGYWTKGGYQFTNRDGEDLTLANLWQDWTGISNVNKSLESQVQENEKNREYNLKLAREQNAANLAQWNRENAYNSPSAQKSRLVAAGLNPDMMYGGSGVSNTAASSPSMTSGAPSTPVDWSSLANKPTIGQTILQGLQIQQMRANVKKTEGEARQAGVNADILETFGIDTSALQKEKLREEVNLLSKEAEGIDYSNTMKGLEHDFAQVYKERIVQNWLQRLSASTQLSENALKEDIETLTMRIAGVNAENSKLVRMSDFTTNEWRLVFDVVRELLSFLK